MHIFVEIPMPAPFKAVKCGAIIPAFLCVYEIFKLDFLALCCFRREKAVLVLCCYL
jgi:hypothetical protein